MEEKLLNFLIGVFFYILILSLGGACLFIFINQLKRVTSNIKFHLKITEQLSRHTIWISGICFLSFIFFSLFRTSLWKCIFWWGNPLVCLLISILVLKSYRGKLIYSTLLAISGAVLMWNYTPYLMDLLHLKASSLPISLIEPHIFAIINYEKIMIFLIMMVTSVGIYSSLARTYFLIRRNKDNFGRDYYKYSVKFASKWSMLLILFLCLWPVKILKHELSQQTLIFSICSTIFIFLSTALSYRVIKAEVPLRHKGSIIASVIFGYIGIGLFFKTIF